MIPINDIRTALAAVDPPHAFDALIRRELAAGRTPTELFDELKAFWPEVSVWPE